MCVSVRSVPTREARLTNGDSVSYDPNEDCYDNEPDVSFDLKLCHHRLRSTLDFARFNNLYLFILGISGVAVRLVSEL